MKPGGSRGTRKQLDLSRLSEGRHYRLCCSPKPVKSSAATGHSGRVQGLGLTQNHFTSLNLSCLKSQMKVIQESTFLSVMTSQHFVFPVLNITVTSIKV